MPGAGPGSSVSVGAVASTVDFFPQTWLPWLAALKAAGTAGLLLGLMGVPVTGVIAATGLVLFLIGAIAAHIRARVHDDIAFPGGYLTLATTALVLAVAR
ncbi:DoxX family protein [Streptomyces sp. B1I3]|uniref:DoxX family protein n=1 Tax=Streptomyces sp. B1I3 TaxID=3042264 RepID=UPI002786B104|nr:DoxX family protein [Streptomyces sp. B1I3]MDQ0791725.1 membrane-bound ClpP family serine protease [Streptomyces sp. B1I3]